MKHFILALALIALAHCSKPKKPRPPQIIITENEFGWKPCPCDTVPREADGYYYVGTGRTKLVVVFKGATVDCWFQSKVWPPIQKQ